ncbi:YchJ family protein [Pontiella agarivorans]|uniref:YchJ family metal-binding protein n=1 Tax=Pontiella agarivorans TaxID=3038953 RepID=A0ABU5MXE8_9BACT|nr:YchJ family metal-binding protein [Pontiella agarivorans]MDZ8118813.1 YchJ family metal-binding protein [Pontiella agarivorans]
MNSERCPCGSGESYDACCGRFISGAEIAQTAEQLMRSRYSAYVKKDVDYLVRTTLPKSRTPDLAQNITEWMNAAEWIRLLIIRAEETTVDFVAQYRLNGSEQQHREHSVFKQKNGEWFYVGEA